MSNAEVAAIESVSVATMNHHRVTGYETTFVYRASSGVIVVTDSVGLYKSVTAAKWQYKLFTGENKPPAGSKRISMSGIGSEARGYATPGGVSVYLQHGVYTARIDLSGRGVALSPIVLRLARTLDGRMRTG